MSKFTVHDKISLKGKDLPGILRVTQVDHKELSYSNWQGLPDRIEGVAKFEDVELVESGENSWGYWWEYPILYVGDRVREVRTGVTSTVIAISVDCDDGEVVIYLDTNPESCTVLDHYEPADSPGMDAPNQKEAA